MIASNPVASLIRVGKIFNVALANSLPKSCSYHNDCHGKSSIILLLYNQSSHDNQHDGIDRQTYNGSNYMVFSDGQKIFMPPIMVKNGYEYF